MKLKHYCVFGITVMLILLLPSYHLHAEVVSGSMVDFVISRDGLQSRMGKLTAKQGIDKESKAKEMSWYQLADTNIADQQWFEFLSSTYLKVLLGFPFSVTLLGAGWAHYCALIPYLSKYMKIDSTETFLPA